ncbi:MAG: ester cyclase [Ferruginibacter sp.]|nr:ester cyclase [Cytophagales bacterium]
MHKQLVYQFIELMNSGQIDRFGEVIAEDYRQHNPVVEPGLTGIQNGARWFATVFPDAHAEVQAVVAEGDTVVARFGWTGTHRGELFGVPATHKRVSWTGTDWWRVENGKLAEHWDVVDWAALMQQINETA